MLVVLTQLVRPGHHLPLRYPLLQVVDLSVQLEEAEPLLQFAPPLL